MAKSLKSKEDIFYSAIVHAYIESSMERDRSLLYICSGGIAVLITLMTTVGVHSACELTLYILSFLSLGASIILILHIFKLNRHYLIQLDSNDKPDESELKKYDSIIYTLFIVGVSLLFAIAVITSINQLQSQEQAMSDKKDNNKKQIDESVQDLSKLIPNKKSLDDLAKLKPQSDSTDGKKNDTDKPKK